MYILWPCNTNIGDGLTALSDGASRNATDLNQTGFQSPDFDGVCGIQT